MVPGGALGLLGFLFVAPSLSCSSGDENASEGQWDENESSEASNDDDASGVGKADFLGPTGNALQVVVKDNSQEGLAFSTQVEHTSISTVAIIEPCVDRFGLYGQWIENSRDAVFDWDEELRQLTGTVIPQHTFSERFCRFRTNGVTMEVSLVSPEPLPQSVLDAIDVYNSNYEMCNRARNGYISEDLADEYCSKIAIDENLFGNGGTFPVGPIQLRSLDKPVKLHVEIYNRSVTLPQVSMQDGRAEVDVTCGYQKTSFGPVTYLCKGPKLAELKESTQTLTMYVTYDNSYLFSLPGIDRPEP